MHKRFFLLCISIWLLTASGTAFPADAAIETPDSITNLEEVSITGVSRRLMGDSGSGKVSLNVDALGHVIRAFGEADPLNYARLTGGVTAGSDYSSGLSVQGAGFGNSLYRVGEATVWFPYHFGGIFSMFNGMHFPRLEIDKGLSGNPGPARLGAVFDVLSRNNIPDRIHASINAGMTASSLGLRIPCSPRFSIDLSGRISYLDKLYGPLLDMKDQKITYTFGESALTAIWQPNDNDKLKLDAVFNSDRLGVFDNNYDLDTYLKWRNIAASLVWTHSGTHPLRIWTTWSGFHNSLRAEMPGFGVDVPSMMMEAKTGMEMTLNRNGSENRSGLWSAGAEVIYYRSRPQNTTGLQPYIDALEANLRLSWSKNITERWRLSASIKGYIYTTKDYTSLLPSPSTTIEYKGANNRAAFNVAMTPQFVHQTGLADIGLSSNFWFPATSSAPRELAAGFSFSYSHSFFNGLLNIGFEPYFRRILNDPEYFGIMLDLLDRNYTLEDHLLRSNGFNTGFDLTANLSHGPFTLLASYSLGIARRRFPMTPDRYLPAISEGLNTLNSLVSYRIGNHWTVGATFTLASGRCYTPISSVYMLGENVIMNYGQRNSARLPLYHRLDLSGAFRFHTGGPLPLTHNIVVSLINAYGQRNIEICSYRFSSSNGTFYLHQVPSLYRFLPSLSYSIDF